MGNLNTPNSGESATDPAPGSGVDGATRVGAENPQVHNLEESDSEQESYKETSEKISATKSSMTAYLEKMFSNRFDAMQSMVERLPGVAPPIRRSNPDSYADTPFVEEIASVEMPRKFSFPSIKMYDVTGDPDDYIAQYNQRMLAVALPKESWEATMCKGFGSTLIEPALQWYINLPTRSISSFASLSDKFVEQFASSRSLEKTSDGLYEILQHRVEPLRDYIARFNQKKVAVPEFSIPTAISAFKRGLLPDGGLYKELTMYPCKTMEDVLSRAWAQVKWEEDVASHAKAQPKQDQKSARSDQGNRDERSSQRAAKDSGNRNRGRFQYRPLEKEEGMSVSTWPDISHLSISTPELVNILRQMGQQFKWPQKMKAPDSFRNPGLWCDFHRDHGHKTEDCIAQRIEVNELLQKGHLWEFLSEKAKNHLNKEVPAKSAGAIPASPPRQDRVIHVISGGSEISGVSHAAAKKSTRNAKHGLETTKPKRLLQGVAPPIRRSNPDSYADTPFVEGIASVEMPRKFSFPSIKMYDGTGDPDDHIVQYKQRMLAVALPKESREATICKGFGSTLIGPALQWYINLPTKSISSFASLSDKFVEQFASSRSLEKTSDGLYEILQHRVETCEIT
ncbi:hypothetical protein F2Q70_00022338 [Brassica cretica]|uniref:Retrotransposon gag domain-containing protein n=1 Tax=Brassica cretica TaxID=69181 RepID=A0A8S9GVU2_BRACR|nr:hypothetical protein F2Q70_00022338 [Brassica cretica]